MKHGRKEPVPAPFGLETGLRLEDRNVTLPWGAGLESLKVLGQPALDTGPFYAGGKFRLDWKSARILGGLEADLIASLGGRRDETLQDVFVYPQFLRESGEPERQFERAVSELKERIGAPTRKGRRESSLVEGLFFPNASWVYESVAIHLTVFEGLSAFYIPYFEMRIARKGGRPKGPPGFSASESCQDRP